ncbi:MAG: hypothetical protein FWD25_01400 [Clostridia bacterium]|nr:hypothetical protein [Clostridia bacterium]
MKKMMALSLALMIVAIANLSDSSFATAPVILSGIESFSYDEDINIWAVGKPGVVSDGFINTEENPITSKEDAIALAKNEVKTNFIYNAIAVYYDDANEMWMVLFFTMNMLGGGQSVYLNRAGATTLIVFGE